MARALRTGQGTGRRDDLQELGNAVNASGVADRSLYGQTRVPTPGLICDFVVAGAGFEPA
jgi:hypothetical protein